MAVPMFPGCWTAISGALMLNKCSIVVRDCDVTLLIVREAAHPLTAPGPERANIKIYFFGLQFLFIVFEF